GDVAADERQFGDARADPAADEVETDVAADDAAPGEQARPEPGHRSLGDQRAGDDQRHVFGQGYTKSAGKEQAEEGRISHGCELAPRRAGEPRASRKISRVARVGSRENRLWE